MSDTAGPMRPGETGRLLAILVSLYAVAYLDRSIVALVAPALQADLAITATQLGLLQGLGFVLFYAVLGLPLGALVDRVSRRAVIFCGVLVWSLAASLGGLSTSFTQLLIARLGVGAGEAALSPAGYSMVADSAPRSRLAFMSAIFSSGAGIGSALSVLAGGLLMTWAVAQGGLTLPIVGHLAPWQVTSHTLARVDALAPAGRRPDGTKAPKPKRVAAVQTAIREALMPPLLPASVVAGLPQATGVYYFHNEAGEVIYVGKSINIYKRIQQHFAIDVKSRKSLEFKNSIADITWELTGSELVALLYESHLIKQLKPAYNRAQRRSVFPAGIYLRVDEQGYKRLAFGRADARNAEIPIIALGNQYKAQGFLYHKVAKYNLCQKLCGLYKTTGPCFDYQVHHCQGACIGQEPPESYNLRVDEAIDSISYEHETFVVIGAGRTELEKSIVLVENGRYRGFGYVDETFTARKLADFRDVIKEYTDNKDIQQIIRLHLRTKHKGERVKVFG